MTASMDSGPELRVFCDAVRSNGMRCQLEAHPNEHVHVTYVDGWLETWSRPVADNGKHGILNQQDILITAPKALRRDAEQKP